MFYRLNYKLAVLFLLVLSIFLLHLCNAIKINIMKRIIYLAFALIVFASCETRNIEVKGTDIVYQGQDVRIYVMDSCEYIGVNYVLAHKGNCKYCIERNKK